MSDIAIKIENISKRYRIGMEEMQHDTLGGALAAWIKSPINNFRRIHKLSNFNDKENSEDIIWALRDISFEVKSGEVLGIIGSNGAGKSTLLKILARITVPTYGKAVINGRIASLLEVGTGFHPELTGRENVYLNGTILGMSKNEVDRKFDEIIEFSEVEKFIDTPVKRYSSGMRVRLAFAVAAHLDPECLLIDEVLAVGDYAFQKKCLGKMGEIAGEGRTVLFVSHNMGAISDLTSRCIYLKAGYIKEEGATSEVVFNYIKDNSIESSGNSELSSIPRSDFTKRKAIFTWIRMINSQNCQTNNIYEKEPIIIDVGISLNKAVKSIQIGCGVVRLDSNVELFTAPSNEYRNNFISGDYQARLNIKPNYLRDGMYAVNLKLFADGIRQETLRQAFKFSILKKTSENEDPFYQKWVNGPLRFDYKWQELKPIDME